MNRNIGQNDIEAKNNSIIQNGKLSLNNDKYFELNKTLVQPTTPRKNLETTQKIEKVKKKTQTISEIIAKFAVVAVAGVSGVVSLDVLAPPPIKAEISYLEAFDSEVVYCISLSEFDEGVKIVLYNDFTNREQTMEEAITEGIFENLQTNMKYTFVVKQGAKILAKETLVTKTREEELYEEPYEEDPYIEPINDDRTQRPNSDGPYTEPIEDDDPEYINIGDDTGQVGGGDYGRDPTGYIG